MREVIRETKAAEAVLRLSGVGYREYVVFMSVLVLGAVAHVLGR